jgi:hypothetical protein
MNDFSVWEASLIKLISQALALEATEAKAYVVSRDYAVAECWTHDMTPDSAYQQVIDAAPVGTKSPVVLPIFVPDEIVFVEHGSEVKLGRVLQPMNDNRVVRVRELNGDPCEGDDYEGIDFALNGHRPHNMSIFKITPENYGAAMDAAVKALSALNLRSDRLIASGVASARQIAAVAVDTNLCRELCEKIRGYQKHREQLERVAA